MIWVIEGAKPKQVTEALSIHNKMLSPKFRMAENIANAILEEYKEAGKLEIHYRDIAGYIRKNRLPFKGSDIPELVARYLHAQGMKVWR